jgi:hypothetical protein
MASRTGILCLGASVVGWTVVVLVALLFPGGHPPLSAYVTVPVGLVADWVAVRRGSGSRALRYGSLVGNGIVLAIAAGLVVRIVLQSVAAAAPPLTLAAAIRP